MLSRFVLPAQLSEREGKIILGIGVIGGNGKSFLERKEGAAVIESGILKEPDFEMNARVLRRKGG